MAQRAKALRKLLAGTKRTANQAQASYMKAEDVLTGLEEREGHRQRREQQQDESAAQRFPALRRPR